MDIPNDASITRLAGAMMLEQNDEWSLNRRYMQLEGLEVDIGGRKVDIFRLHAFTKALHSQACPQQCHGLVPDPVD